MDEKIRLNKKLYKKQAVLDALQEFEEFSSVSISESEKYYDITISSKDGAEMKEEFANLCLSFMK